MPKLSPSTAHTLLTKGPREAWARHRELGGHPKPSSDSQVAGRMWHAALLGKSHDLKVVDAKDFRTNAAKDAKAAIEAEGKIAVVKPKLEGLADHAAMIRSEFLEEGIDLDRPELCEVELHWPEFTDAGEKVECKGHADYIDPDHPVFGPLILDLKSGSVPGDDEAPRRIVQSHALLQETAYRNGAEFVYGIPAHEWTFLFGWFETDFPYQIALDRMPGDFREISLLEWRRAVHTWHRCLSAGTEREHWPKLVQGVRLLNTPGWLLQRALMREAEGDEG